MIHIVQLFLLANSGDYYTGILLVGRENVSSSYVTRVTKSAHCEQFLSAINRLRGSRLFPPEIFWKRRVSCVCPTCLLDARRPRARETQMRKSVDPLRDVRRDLSTHFVADHQIGRGHFLVPFTPSGVWARLRAWYSIASRGTRDVPEAASETRRTRVYGL